MSDIRVNLHGVEVVTQIESLADLVAYAAVIAVAYELDTDDSTLGRSIESFRLRLDAVLGAHSADDILTAATRRIRHAN